MTVILGTEYLTTKEASNRYGYSYQWFKMRRKSKSKPDYIRFVKRGKIYYPLEKTDKWFQDQKILNE